MKNLNLNNLFRFVLFCVMLFLASTTFVNAQSTANYAFSTNTVGSLGLDMNGNTIDMSSGTTQLVGADLDDVSSAITGIGFDFFLYGSNFSQFSASSNGLIQLGSTVVGSATYLASGGSIASPRIGALVADLRTGIAGKVHCKMIGNAPNRCLVVEFLNMSITYVATPGSNDGTYQVRLYETTGALEFVYGSMYRNNSSTTTASICSGFSVNSTANSLAAVTTSTNTVSYTTFNLNSYINATNIPNLHSTADGSRRVYKFTPPLPTAPSGLSFTSVAATSMSLNWTDNSTNENAFAIYRSVDGINYTFAGTTAANTITFNATGLNFSTLYYWQVYAVSEGALSSPALSGSQATLAPTLGGTKTVGAGGDYSNLTTAFAAINSSGLIGNVDLQLITGYPASPETYPIQSSNTAAVGPFNVKVYPTVSGLSITSNNVIGTLNLNNAKNITFDGRVNQTGANDLIIANTNVGTSYAILLNNDASNNIIQNSIVQSTNTSTTSGTIVFGTTTGANGNDNNSISSCDIRDGATTPVNAIYSVGTTTTAAQFNDNNTITGNNISNYFSAGSTTIGVLVGAGNSSWTISANKLFQTATRTYTTGNTHNGIQVNNTSGNGFVITGNTIGFASAGGTGTYTMAGTIATRFIGINISAGTTTASSVQGNTIANFSLNTSSGATTGNGIFAGINVTGGNVNVGTVTANIIGASTGTGSIVATTSTAGGLIVGINSSSTGTVNITGNSVGAINGLGTTATAPASITGIQVSAGTPTINNNSIGSTVTANSINAVTIATTGAQLVRGIDVTSGVTLATNIQSNTISNLTQSGTSTTGFIRGISYAGTGIATISLNTVSFLSGANANTSIANLGIQGILHNGVAIGGGIISNNTVHTLTGTNSGAVQSNVNGIGISGLFSAVVTKNTIYNLKNSSTGVTATTPPTVSGIIVRSIGAVGSIFNNMISLGNTLTTNTEIIGIWNNATSTSAINIYHNSINIEGVATSGALPSYGFLRGDNSATAITSTVDVRNNIFNNTRSGGTGKHYAIANQSATASATGWGLNASNYNLLNSTNTATVGLWGSTDQTFIAWRVAATSDANSFSNFPVLFVNTVTGDLHLNMGVTATPIESGGATIAAVIADFDSQSRPGPSGSVNGGGTSPDLGADEIDAVPALPVVTLNSVSPATITQCVAVARNISVNVTTLSGTITAVNLGYSVNGVQQANIPMTNAAGTTWEATLPLPTPANAVITWFVSATNSIGLNSTYSGASYSDEPLTGVTATASTNAPTVCAGNPTNLSAVLSKVGSSVSGLGTGTSSLSSISPYYHGYGGAKTQFIYRASELTAMGFTAGNITSISLNVTTLGTPVLNSFTINIGNTAQSAAVSNTAILSGLTEVYNNAAQTLTLGTNLYTFSSPFNWDGVSNIVLSFNFSNFNTGGTSTTVTTDPAVAFTSSLAIYADNATATCLFTAPASAQACMGTNSNSTSSVRPTITFTGNKAPAITSVTWLNGATTVGTGNPLTVNPTTTTTYSANITASGCTVSPSPTVTVTVNPLPTVPTALNSAQCGTQIPSASVASTSGLSTPTFKWYDLAVAGTALQNSISTTFTSNVAATTTFYVAEVNTVTGCESPRVAVTVTVATADGILASVNNIAICIGSSVTLTASNTNATPNQSYTYTWTGLAGSGIASVNGSSTIATPTLPGTYTYTLAGVDGGCNAVSSVNLTVNPFVAAITPVNATCNAGNDGSFTLGITTCGTAPYTYSVDGGSYGAIPTNLIAGTYSVLVKDANGYISAALPLTITQPAAVTVPAGISNVTVCQNAVSALLTVPSIATITVPVTFGLVAQPAVIGTSTLPTTVAANPNIIATATLPALPAGATITSVNFTMNGLTPIGFSWANDVFFGFSGAYSVNYANGLGAPGSATAFNFTQTYTGGTYNPNGGTVELNYYDRYDDNAGAECTFPIGAAVGTLTIIYTVNNPTVNWFNASISGTQVGTGTPFETVGTSVLPTTATPGVYTFHAQGQNGTCASATRTPVTVTVNAAPATNAGNDQTVCSGTAITLSGSGASTYSWNNGVTNAVAFTPSITTTYTVTGTGVNGCTSTDQVLVTVNTSPTVNAGVDQTVCAGTSVTLAGSGALSYSWNNSVTNAIAFTPATTATYSVTGTAANNCTATDQVVVTVNSLPSVNAGVDQVVCAGTSVTLTASGATSYVWNNSVTNAVAFTPAATTTYTVTGTNANGCQNTDQVVVTVNNSSTSSTPITACNSYTWTNGTTYTVGGTYSQVLTNAVGCDSTATLVLTITNSSTSSTPITACNSYTWTNGTTYTIGGTYSQVLTNAVGCDSTATLVLTITNSSTSSTTVTECDSYTWTNGTTYTVGGTYSQVLTNAVGCDSTATLVLTINNSTIGTDVQIACDSYTWIDGVTYTSNNNTATFLLTSAAGCDSLVTLDLTINVSPIVTATDNGDATISASTGTTYQWIDCGTGLAIAGATSQTYTATVNGSYSVVVSDGTCTDTSSCVVIDNVSIKEIMNSVVSLFPNPTKDFVTLTMTVSNATVTVVDAQGKLLQSIDVVNGGTIDISSYETGIYIFSIKTENGTSIQRISKN